MSVTKFTEGMYYVMAGKGEKWSDYEEFSSVRNAVDHMKALITEWSSPEHYCHVITHFHKGQMYLFKDDNGRVINGNTIHWKNTIIVNDEILFSDERK